MRVELANVVYCGGVGVNALATMCKLIGWLHHHQNTEKTKKKKNKLKSEYHMRNSPENAYDMRALCVARISVAIAKVSLATPESMQHMFNLWCMGHGILFY